MQIDRQLSSEVATKSEPPLDSLIVGSISNCNSLIEQSKDIVVTDAADMKINENEAHHVITHELNEETQTEEKQTHTKVSLLSSNVTSNSTLLEVVNTEKFVNSTVSKICYVITIHAYIMVLTLYCCRVQSNANT